MSNASSCLRAAAHYARRSQLAADADARSTYAELARLWSDMAALAARFDRDRDAAAKAQIYAMMDEVGAVRRKVA